MNIGKELEIVEIETPAVPYEGEEVSPEPVEEEREVVEAVPVEGDA